MQLTDLSVSRRVLLGVFTAGAVGSGLALAGVYAQPPVRVSSAQAVEEHDHADHDHADHDHASTLDGDGRFTGPGEVWPPQPKNAIDVVELDFSDLAAPVAERTVSAAADDRDIVVDIAPAMAALALSEVADAVGVRHNLISITEHEIVPGSEKGEDDEATLIIFYNLADDLTVEVFMDGDALVALVVSPAAQHQPPLSVKEKSAAADLARAHWSAEGDARIDRLEGFTILAVQPGGSYYDSRMAYVSFHLDARSNPELLTWVDLTTETVIEAKVDR